MEEIALKAVKLARDKLTTSNGTTYKGDELKQIIKCACDAAHADYESRIAPFVAKHIERKQQWRDQGFLKSTEPSLQDASNQGKKEEDDTTIVQQPAKRQWSRGGECNKCTKAAEEEKKKKRKEEKKKENRRCSNCRAKKKKHSFVVGEWNKKDGERVCQVCTKAEQKKTADEEKESKLAKSTKEEGNKVGIINANYTRRTKHNHLNRHLYRHGP